MLLPTNILTPKTQCCIPLTSIQITTDSAQPEQCPPWCQVLHALIKQRHRDVERGRDAAERIARLKHDLKVSTHQREKLAQKFTAKERELGALENRVSLL